MKLKSRLLLLQCPFYRILSKTEILNIPPFSPYGARISKSIFIACIIMVGFRVAGHILYTFGGGGNFYEEEGNGLEYRQSNINKHRKKTEKYGYSGLRLAFAVTRSTGEKTA